MNTLRMILILFIMLGAIILVQTNTMYTKSQRQSPLSSTASDVSPASQQEKTNHRNNFLKKLSFPRSIVIKQSSTQVMLQSTVSPSVITAWYKKALQENNLRINSSMITTTNGSIKNSMVAADRTRLVTILIEQKSADAHTFVQIDEVGK